MTRLRYVRIALLTMVVVVLAAAQTTAPQPTTLSVGSAEITDFKGTVTLHSQQGEVLNAQRGLILTPDSTIETAKGSVLLILQDGSQVLVKSHSNVVLRNPIEKKGYFLELLIGNILAKVQKRLGSNPSFRMGTPTAVITVRGTRFSVEVNKRKTIVQVFEGLVEVAGVVEGTPHVLIQPGFWTQVENDRAPQSPRELNPGQSPDDGGGEGNSRNPNSGREHEGQSQPRPPNQTENKPD
jgi:hypothetical protein